MTTEDKNTQFVKDLEKYTALQQSLESVRARLKDIGAELKGLGEKVISDPLAGGTEWELFHKAAAQVEGLVGQYQGEFNQSRALGVSLLARGYIFPDRNE